MAEDSPETNDRITVLVAAPVTAQSSSLENRTIITVWRQESAVAEVGGFGVEGGGSGGGCMK